MKSSVQRAFTLIELLVVMGIIAIISSLVVPTITTVMSGNQLSRASDQVIAVLGMARQMALTKNHPIEVRFYQFGDSQSPGENANIPSSGHFRAIQIFEIFDNGTATAVGKCELLPTNIVFDAGSTLSSLFSGTQTTTQDVRLPRVDTNYNAIAFRFLPDGSANLVKSGTLWFVTLHTIVEGDKLITPPANYTTVQIDPANGGLKIWRP